MLLANVYEPYTNMSRQRHFSLLEFFFQPHDHFYNFYISVIHIFTFPSSFWPSKRGRRPAAMHQ